MMTTTYFNHGVFNTLPRGKRLLSIGVGNGIMERKAKEFGNYVVGVDIDSSCIKNLSRILDESFVLDIEHTKDLPFRKHSFDVILLADVLEHLIDPERILMRLQLYLKDDGYIIVSLPNVANWSIRLALLLGFFQYSEEGILNKGHLRFFTKKTAIKLCKQAGYEVASLSYNTSLVNLAYGFLLSLFPNKGKQGTVEKASQEFSSPAKHSRGRLRVVIKRIAETADAFITHLFPGLLAYQFVFVLKKKHTL